MTFPDHDAHSWIPLCFPTSGQVSQLKKIMSKNEIQFSINIPDKEPYEGKATMKQKKLMWDMGFKDQEMINNLGKQQASSVITQMQGTYGLERKKQSAVKMMKWAVVTLFLSVFAKIGDFSSLALLLFFPGVILLVVSGLRLLFGK